MGLSSQVTRALQAEARAQGYAVVGTEVVRASLGGEAVDRLHACRASPECVALRTRGLGTSRAVVGLLERTEAHYRLRLHLVDLATSRELARLDRTVPISGGRFLSEVHEALPALLRGRTEPRGAIRSRRQPGRATGTATAAPRSASVAPASSPRR